MLDTSWVRAGRWAMGALPLGGDVVVVGGRRTERVDAQWMALSGAIYSADTGQVRPFPDPPAEAIDPTRWTPDTLLLLGDKLCFAGGALSDRRPFRGAACLDRAATWQWIATPAPPTPCANDPIEQQGSDTRATWLAVGALGTAPAVDGEPDPAASFVLCTKRTNLIGFSPADREYGSLHWSLWRVAIQPSEPSP